MIRYNMFPQKWPRPKLGKVVEFLDSQRKPVKASERIEGPFPYYGANGQQGTINGYLFDEPLVLLAEDGGHFGVVDRTIAYQVSGKCWVNNHAHVLRPREKIDIRYLTRVLESYDVTPFITGTTRGKLTKGAAARIPIPLPPLGEQRRIAAVLDKADALRQKRRAALAKLDTLLQATFLHMFGDPVMNPMGWEVKELDDVIDFRTGKLDANAAVGDGQYPFFTCAREVSQIDHFAFDEEVLLMAGNNASADYWVKHFKGKFNAYQRTYVMTLKIPDLSYKYMRMAMEYKLGELKRISKGTNTRYLTLGLLKPLQVQIPDQKAMGKFEKLHDQIVYKKDQMEKGLEHLDNLFHALQQRAFSGQL